MGHTKSLSLKVKHPSTYFTHSSHKKIDVYVETRQCPVSTYTSKYTL